jgi:hypothetical protein
VKRKTIGIGAEPIRIMGTAGRLISHAKGRGLLLGETGDGDFLDFDTRFGESVQHIDEPLPPTATDGFRSVASKQEATKISGNSRIHPTIRFRRLGLELQRWALKAVFIEDGLQDQEHRRKKKLEQFSLR